MDAGGLTLAPGTVVVVESTGPTGESYVWLATVVIGSGQARVEQPPPRVGRALRVAEAADAITLGREAAAALDASLIAASVLDTLGAGVCLLDARLSPDAAVLTLTLDREPPDAERLAQTLIDRFGRMVRLERVDVEGVRRLLHGVDDALLPEGGDRWLVDPGSGRQAPIVEPPHRLTATDLIRDHVPPVPARRRADSSDR